MDCIVLTTINVPNLLKKYAGNIVKNNHDDVRVIVIGAHVFSKDINIDMAIETNKQWIQIQQCKGITQGDFVTF